MLFSLRERFGTVRLAAFAVLALAGVVGLGLTVRWAARHLGGASAQSTNPLILTPALALESLQAKSLYYNHPARHWLLERRPDLLPEDDRKPDSPRGRSFAQAAQNPKLFRQLDREQRFDALYLAGDPTQFQTLMGHLLDTADWKLSYLDHTSMIFRRNVAQEWEPGRLREVDAKLGNLSSSDRALFLAQAASKVLAMRKLSAAKELLDRAVGLDPRTPQVWSGLAEYHMALGEWTAAVAKADRALALDPNCLQALGVKAQSQFSSKHFADALQTSRRLVLKLPDDPQILFYHAKIAHEAGQYGEEIEVLHKLIEMAKEEQRPTEGYRVYLGQAYARDGQGDLAKRELNMVLNQDPPPPEELRNVATELMGLIQKNTNKNERQRGAGPAGL